MGLPAQGSDHKQWGKSGTLEPSLGFAASGSIDLYKQLVKRTLAAAPDVTFCRTVSLPVQHMLQYIMQYMKQYMMQYIPSPDTHLSSC
jgi:hypothetical protein